MVTKLERGKPIPLYFQIAEEIRARIVQGIYSCGEAIPTELLIQDEFEVSRETARKAVSVLINEELIVKVRGKGTFVAQPKVVHRIGSVYGSSEEIKARGLVPSTKILGIDRFAPPHNIQKEMQLSKTAEVVKATRLRFANNKPAAILTSYLPNDLIPGLSASKFLNGSLYKTLEKVYKLSIRDADEIIEAGIVDNEEAGYLEIEKNTPVLVVNRITYLENNRVIEKLKALYRSDIFKYQVKLRGRSLGSQL